MIKSPPRLNDLQLILLAHAAEREGGSLLPVPEKFTGEAARIGKAIPALLKRLLVEEAPVTNRSEAWRDEEQQPFGIFITAAGRALIASANGAVDQKQVREPSESVLEVAASTPRAGTKTELVIGLLKGQDGATITELTIATGWLPHTARAALTGLRKKGHAVERAKRGDVTCYRIAAA